MGQSDDSIATAPVQDVNEKAGSQPGDVSDHSGDDVEKQGLCELPQLKRRLKSRHLQMIAIGMSNPVPARTGTDFLKVVPLELVCSLDLEELLLNLDLLAR